MVRTFITAIIIGGTFALAACNTVRGAGEDLQSVANCTEEMMKRNQC